MPATQNAVPNLFILSHCERIHRLIDSLTVKQVGETVNSRELAILK